jgi:hypothetical protein
MKDACFNKNYRMATWVAVVLIMFHEMTGVNAISSYSNTILSEMNSYGSGLTPTEGTYLIGIFSFVFSLTAGFFVNRFNRKTLLIAG